MGEMKPRPKSLQRPKRTAEDEEIAKVLADSNDDEAAKDEQVRRGMEEVRAKWTRERERKASGRSNAPYELPRITSQDIEQPELE